jgi:hypothetical protein
MNKISDQVLAKIKKKDLKPKSKWLFILKNIAFWALFLLGSLFGAIAFSVMLYVIVEADFLLLWENRTSAMEALILITPFFWIGFMLLVLMLGLYGIKHTKKAYKYSFVSVFTLVLVLNFAFGAGAYYLGSGERLDNIFEEKIEHYKGAEHFKMMIYLRGDRGFIAGEVVKVNDQFLILLDLSQKEWEVNIKKATFIKPVQEGQMIRVIGKKMEDDKFSAKIIAPWQKHDCPNCMMHKKKMIKKLHKRFQSQQGHLTEGEQPRLLNERACGPENTHCKPRLLEQNRPYR